MNGDTVSFHGMILKPDGSEAHEIRTEGPASNAAVLGKEAAEHLRAKAGPQFFEGWE